MKTAKKQYLQEAIDSNSLKKFQVVFGRSMSLIWIISLSCVGLYSKGNYVGFRKNLKTHLRYRCCTSC